MDRLDKLEKSVARIDENFANHALSDSRFQADSAERDIALDKRLIVIEERIKEMPTKTEIAKIVEAEMAKFFTGKGKMAMSIMTSTAIVVASLLTIGGGFKLLAGFLFFNSK